MIRLYNTVARVYNAMVPALNVLLPRLGWTGVWVGVAVLIVWAAGVPR